MTCPVCVYTGYIVFYWLYTLVCDLTPLCYRRRHIRHNIAPIACLVVWSGICYVTNCTYFRSYGPLDANFKLLVIPNLLYAHTGVQIKRLY